MKLIKKTLYTVFILTNGGLSYDSQNNTNIGY